MSLGMESSSSFPKFILPYQEYNQIPTIIPRISEIKFPFLRFIKISGNAIETVEGLSRVHMPKLERINMSNLIMIQVRI